RGAGLLEFVAGTERPSRAGEDDGAGGGIGIGLLEGIADRPHQFRVHGVEGLGPVEHDRSYAVVDGAQDNVGHRLSPAHGCRITRRVLPAVRGRLPGARRLTRAVTPSSDLITPATCSASPVALAVVAASS